MDCLSDQSLRKLLLATATPQESDEWEDHLEACLRCRDRLRAIEEASRKPVGKLFSTVLPDSGLRTEAQDAEEARRLAKQFDFNAIRNRPNSDSEIGTSRDPNFWIGKTLGQYQVLSKLDEGGMGIVFVALHMSLKRQVALKLLHPRLEVSQSAILRFKQEMEILGQLDHPNLAKATDAGESNGTYFIVMELLTGSTLEQVLKSRTQELNSRIIAEWMLQAAAGLEYAHRHGLIHRDIKPANLHLGNDGKVRVLDLGLAAFIQHEEELRKKELNTSLITQSHEVEEKTELSLTQNGYVVGTRSFMSPEQYRGEKLDSRSDLYAFGCTLYKMLSGKSPTWMRGVRQEEHDREVELAVVELETKGVSSSQNLDLLRELLKFHPADRPRDMRTVIDRLRDWTKVEIEEPYVATESKPKEPMRLGAVPPPHVSAQATTIPQTPHSSNAVMLLGFLCIVLMLFVGCIAVVPALFLFRYQSVAPDVVVQNSGPPIVVNEMGNGIGSQTLGPAPPITNLPGVVGQPNAKGPGPVRFPPSYTPRITSSFPNHFESMRQKSDGREFTGTAVTIQPGQYLEVQDSAQLFQADKVSLELWLRFREHRFSQFVFGTRAQSLPTGPFGSQGFQVKRELKISFDEIHFELDSTLGRGPRFGGVSADSSWKHYAVTKNWKTWKFYVDGKLIETSEENDLGFGGPFAPSSGNLRVGSSSTFDFDSGGFGGDIRALRISDTVRYKDSFTPPIDFERDGDAIVLLDFAKAQENSVPNLIGEKYGAYHNGTLLKMKK